MLPERECWKIEIVDMTEGTNMQPVVPSSTARVAVSRKASLLQRARLEMEIDPVGAGGADTGIKEDVKKDLKNEVRV